MLYYFMLHPAHYWIPFGINLVILIVLIKFFGHLLSGEAKAFKEPTILFGSAAFWPLFDAMIIVGSIFWIAGKIIGFIIGNKNVKP